MVVYANLNSESVVSYGYVKRALLHCYNVNDELINADSARTIRRQRSPTGTGEIIVWTVSHEGLKVKKCQ